MLGFVLNKILLVFYFVLNDGINVMYTLKVASFPYVTESLFSFVKRTDFNNMVVWSPEVNTEAFHFRNIQDTQRAHHSPIENLSHKVKYTKSYWLNWLI